MLLLKRSSILIAYPYLITKETYERDVVKLPGLGAKTLSKACQLLSCYFL
jgi:hypothetical protein